MKYSLLILLIINILYYNLKAQNKYDNTWALGYGKIGSWPNGIEFGGITLSFDPTLSIAQHDFVSDSPAACISNKEGELVAYTDGCRIYNNKHQVMKNGDTLNPGIVFNKYCRSFYPQFQNALFLPSPNDTNEYYLFHIRSDDVNYYPANLLYTKLRVNTTDLTEKVEYKNRLVFKDSFALGEYVAATRHGNGRDWWIVNPQGFKDGHHVSLLTPDGVQYMGLQGTQDSINNWACCGQSCFSTDGSKYFLHLQQQGLRMFDFDRCTGRLSNPFYSPQDTTQDRGATGIATSPNSRVLYVSSNRKIVQYDLWATDFLASKTTVAVYDGVQAPFPTTFFQMHLAPDGKIYLNSTNANHILHVINKPDEPGMACDAQPHGLTLPSLTGLIMPNMANYRLGPLKGSPCDTITLSAAEPRHELILADGIDTYPNPAHDYVRFDKLSFQQGLSGRLRLYNMAGGLVWAADFPQGEHSMSVPVAQLPPGLYVWEYLNERGQRAGGRVVKE